MLSLSKRLKTDPRDPQEFLRIFVPEKINGVFEGKSIVSVDQFSKEDLRLLFEETRRMREKVKRGTKIVAGEGKILALLFWEPSTRTDLSFQAAMERIGGQIISPNGGIVFSSFAGKNENLADTIRAVGCYADVIVIRHPSIGSSYEAAYYLKELEKKTGRRVPVISGGDGAGEHPTQALLDLFTIEDFLGSIEGKKVAMVGDLKYGRTVHSLSKLLMLIKGVVIYCVAPEILKMPPKLKDKLESSGCEIHETSSLEEILPEVDVIYLTRVQKERFEDRTAYERVKDSFVITPEVLTKAKKGMILMHPLPRVYEMGGPEENDALDRDPRAAYFHQMENGMYIRMALLKAVLGK